MSRHRKLLHQPDGDRGRLGIVDALEMKQVPLFSLGKLIVVICLPVKFK